jgi:DNA-binding winged helix-turn-helix (wHTH) protein
MAPYWVFGPFRFDPDNARVWPGAQAITLTPKAFAVLQYLLEDPDRLISKEVLLEAVWPDTAVSDAVLKVRMGEIRKALGDSAKAPRFIATVHRRGRDVRRVVQYRRQAAEVKQTYARAWALCEQVGETPQLFPTLRGLWRFYLTRAALPTARELGEQLLKLTQRETAPMTHLEAHEALGNTLFHLGEFAAARTHLEQGIALTNPTAQQALVLRHGVAPGVRCLAFAALTLCYLGFPAQALRRSQEALTQAQALAHPYSLATAHHFAAHLHHHRREVPAVREQAEALQTLATGQGFPLFVGHGTYWRGWALVMQGQGEVGLAQMH